MQNDASDSGFVRLFNFLTPAGRMILAPPEREMRGGIVGGVTLEDFLAKASSPGPRETTLWFSVVITPPVLWLPPRTARGSPSLFQ